MNFHNLYSSVCVWWVSSQYISGIKWQFVIMNCSLLLISHLTLAKYLTRGTPRPHLRSEEGSLESLVVRYMNWLRDHLSQFLGPDGQSIQTCWILLNLCPWRKRNLEKVENLSSHTARRLTTGFWLLVLSLYLVLVLSELWEYPSV